MWVGWEIRYLNRISATTSWHHLRSTIGLRSHGTSFWNGTIYASSLVPTRDCLPNVSRARYVLKISCSMDTFLNFNAFGVTPGNKFDYIYIFREILGPRNSSRWLSRYKGWRSADNLFLDIASLCRCRNVRTRCSSKWAASFGRPRSKLSSLSSAYEQFCGRTTILCTNLALLIICLYWLCPIKWRLVRILSWWDADRYFITNRK